MTFQTSCAACVDAAIELGLHPNGSSITRQALPASASNLQGAAHSLALLFFASSAAWKARAARSQRSKNCDQAAKRRPVRRAC